MSDQIIIKIPSETKYELKLIATKQKTTMTHIITKLIDEYIQEYNNNTPKDI